MISDGGWGEEIHEVLTASDLVFNCSISARRFGDTAGSRSAGVAEVAVRLSSKLSKWEMQRRTGRY